MDELPQSSTTGTVAMFAGTGVKRDHKAITGWQVDVRVEKEAVWSENETESVEE